MAALLPISGDLPAARLPPYDVSTAVKVLATGEEDFGNLQIVRVGLSFSETAVHDGFSEGYRWRPKVCSEKIYSFLHFLFSSLLHFAFSVHSLFGRFQVHLLCFLLFPCVTPFRFRSFLLKVMDGVRRFAEKIYPSSICCNPPSSTKQIQYTNFSGGTGHIQLLPSASVCYPFPSRIVGDIKQKSGGMCHSNKFLTKQI